jgi:hypothetical protein
MGWNIVASRHLLIYIADVEQSINLPCRNLRYTITVFQDFVALTSASTALELAEADRYAPQILSDLHGRVVRWAGAM